VRGTLAILAIALMVAKPLEAQRASPSVEWLPAGGLHFGGPQRASLALGALAVPSRGESNYAFVALAEPGLGGAKIRAGVASVTAFITGFELQGALLRTFGNPGQGERWQTYAGGEFRAMFVLINVGIGEYAALGGGRALTTFTFGLGL
jgi:hypothetical protein